MAGTRETVTILQKLLHQNSAGVALLKSTQFAELCQLYGLTKVTTQWISRAIQKDKIDSDIEEQVRNIVLRIEDLIERFAPLPVSFAHAEHIKSIFELIDLGLDIGTSVRPNNSSNNDGRDNTAAQPTADFEKAVTDDGGNSSRAL